MNSLSENSSTQCEPSDSKRHSKLLINDLWAQRKIGTRGEYNFTFNLARKRLCRNDMYWTAQRKKDLKTVGFIKFCLALSLFSESKQNIFLVSFQVKLKVSLQKIPAHKNQPKEFWWEGLPTRYRTLFPYKPDPMPSFFRSRIQNLNLFWGPQKFLGASEAGKKKQSQLDPPFFVQK